MPLHHKSLSFLATVAFLLFIFDKNLKENLKYIWKNYLLVVLAALFLFYLLWVIGSDNPGNARANVEEAKKFLLPLLFYPYIKNEDVKKFLTAFLLGMVVSEITSYGIFFEILPPTEHGIPQDPSPFMNHVSYSMFLIFALFFIWQKFLVSKNRNLKLFLALYFLIVFFNLFITGGRSGQLLFFLSFFIFFILYFEKKILAAIVAISIIGTMFLGLFFISDNFKARVLYADRDISLMLNNNYNTSWGNRVGEFIVSYHIIKDNFFFGVGTGDEIDEHRRVVKEMSINKRNYENLHSQFTDIFIQIGILGLLTYLLFFYRLSKIPVNEETLFNFKVLYIFAIIYFSFTSRILTDDMSYFFMMFLVVLLNGENRGVFNVNDVIDLGKIKKISYYGLWAGAVILLSELDYYLNHGGYERMIKDLI